MRASKQDLFFWYSLFLSCGICVYIVMRAMLVGITYDEAWTISGFVPFSLTDILNYNPCDANNHLLNTVLIKFLYGFLPNSILVARLPNMLAGLVYVLYAYKFSNKLSGSTRYFIFTALLLNPFLLDFFSLARGYGLAMGFLMLTLYYLKQFAEEKKLGALWLSLIALLGLSCSMLSSLHPVLPAYFLLAVLSLRNKPQRLIQFGSVIITLALNVVLLYTPIQKLKENNSFYYGGNSNFFSDTIVSLSKYFVGSQTQSNAIVITSAFLMLVAAIVLAIHLRKINVKNYGAYSIELLLLAAIASVIVQFYLLDTRYVTDRTALFFYPLFVIALAAAIDTLGDSNPMRITLAALCLAVSINFIFQCNLYKTQTWFFDAHSEAIIDLLKIKSNKEACSAQFSWPLRKSLEYYRDRNFKALKLDYKVASQAIKEGDYVIYLNSSIDQVDYQRGYDVLVQYEKDTVMCFPAEHLYVFKLRTSP